MTDPIAEPRSAAFRAKWRAMVEAEASQARRLGYAMAEALTALIGFLGPDGRCFPAMATVAKAAGVCPRTVNDAVQRAAVLGYLTIIRRTEVLADGRTVQASNAYAFALPIASVPGRRLGLAWRKSWWERLKARRRGGNSVRRVCAEKADSMFFLPPAAAQAELNKIRIAREETRRLAWCQRHSLIPGGNTPTTRANLARGGP